MSDPTQTTEFRKGAAKLYHALEQLLKEVRAAGFETATDYNWPKAIADAKEALREFPIG